MKNLLIGLLVLGSFSAFAGDINLKCSGFSLKTLDKFSYTAEKELLVTDLKINIDQSAYIIIADGKMVVAKQNADIEGKKGASVLIITQASEEDDTLIDGVNVFNTTFNTNTPGNNEDGNLYDDFDVKTANLYTGASFSLMDVESGFGLSCVRK